MLLSVWLKESSHQLTSSQEYPELWKPCGPVQNLSIGRDRLVRPGSPMYSSDCYSCVLAAVVRYTGHVLLKKVFQAVFLLPHLDKSLGTWLRGLSMRYLSSVKYKNMPPEPLQTTQVR